MANAESGERYLRLTVLPDLGGHIYSCLDKRSGREMFYANTAIKKALIGYRGAWAAFGVEFNFPVSHNWMSMSPVDFATIEHPDGSGQSGSATSTRCTVANGVWSFDSLPGARCWSRRSISLTSAARDIAITGGTTGRCRSGMTRQLVYPTELMATHGFTRIQRWPIDDKGQDLSVIRNQADGPVSLFTYATRRDSLASTIRTRAAARFTSPPRPSSRPTRCGRGGMIATPPTGVRLCPMTIARTWSCRPGFP